MKLFLSRLLAFLLIAQLLLLSLTKVYSKSCPFRNVLKSLSKSSKDILIIDFVGDDRSTTEQILKSSAKENFPIKVKNLDSVARNELKNSAVLSFKSVERLKTFNRKVSLTNKYPTPLQFFIIIRSATISEITTLDDTSVLKYQYFMIEDEVAIRLMTFIWYTSEHCNVPQLIEVNSFDKNLGKWESSTFTISKFENFHGCCLLIGVVVQYPALMYNWTTGPNFEYSGFHFDMLKDFASALNFNLLLNPVMNDQSFYFKNLSSDLFLFHMVIWNALKGQSFISQPYIFEDELLAVPPGEDYSVYEKLYVPFDKITWILIVFTFFAAFLTIFLLLFTKRNFRDFVIGKDVRTPSLNVLTAFFGISQVKLPSRNFSRFLLMMFIIQCLIIRTAYQGKLFEIMQKELKKPQIASIEEAIKKDFTFHLASGFLKAFDNSMDFIQR